MPLRHLPPGLLERGHGEVLSHGTHDLLDIHPRMILLQRVVQHALLEGR